MLGRGDLAPLGPGSSVPKSATSFIPGMSSPHCSSISPSVRWGQQSQPARKRNAENIHALGRVHPWGAGGVMRG